MSLIAFVADSHLRGRDLKNRISVFTEMMNLCRARGVSQIFHAGDLFDKGSVADSDASSEVIVKAFIDAFEGEGRPIPMTLLSGNHDQYGDFGNGLDYIHHPLITVIQDTPQLVDVWDDTTVACIPWIRNEKNYSRIVYDFLNGLDDSDQCRIILGHVNIIGCSIGQAGYVTAENYFSFGLPDLQKTKFNPTNMFFGHIHSRMQLGGNAMYLGALTQLRYHEDEGKKAGFHLFDTLSHKLEFIDLSHLASEYFTIKEEDLPAINLEKDYARFYTSYPDKYRHLSHVTAMLQPLPEEAQVETFREQIKSNELNINQFIGEFCRVKELKEPTSLFYETEKNSLNLNFSSSQTGLDFIKDIQVKGVGVHKNKKVEFKKGFNCITGPNGSGKTSIIETVYGCLYENFPSRGNIKNYMKKGSSIEVNLSAKGVDYNIRKELANKRLMSYINDKSFELVNQYRAAITPIFGDATLFGKLVFQDQGSEFDLVTAKDSNRLEVLRDLFDLKYFDTKHKEYKDQLKEATKELADYSKSITLLEKYIKDYEEIIVPEEKAFSEERLRELKALSLLSKRENAVFNNQIAERKELEHISKFEKTYLVEDLQKKEDLIKDLTTKLSMQSRYEGIGCKNSVLPCSFLKDFVPVDTLLIKKKLEEVKNLFPKNEWEDYKYLKGKKRSSLCGVQYTSDRELEVLQEEITQLEVAKGSAVLYEQLVKAKAAAASRAASQREVVSSQSVEELEERIEALRFLVELCSKSGISLYIIDVIKNELQQILNELIIFSELGIRLKLSTSKKDDLDSFQILFGEDEYDINLASGGEIGLVQILFKLAIMIYLNRYFGNYKVIILDEPSAALDVANTEAVASIFQTLCSEFNQIIVVTHSEALANSCDHRVRL